MLEKVGCNAGQARVPAWQVPAVQNPPGQSPSIAHSSVDTAPMQPEAATAAATMG
jgi:hypothetical protein